MYVDFEYYTNTFGGTEIPEASFTRYEIKSRAFIDNITFDRLKNDNLLIDDSVKNAMCEIMELNFKLDEASLSNGESVKSSETVGNYSVTYAVSDVEKNAVDRTQLNKVKYYNIAKEYLGNSGLLYRGV